jgi:hypothetical protein
MKHYLYLSDFGIFIPITRKTLEDLQRVSGMKIVKCQSNICYWHKIA